MEDHESFSPEFWQRFRQTIQGSKPPIVLLRASSRYSYVVNEHGSEIVTVSPWLVLAVPKVADESEAASVRVVLCGTFPSRAAALERAALLLDDERRTDVMMKIERGGDDLDT